MKLLTAVTLLLSVSLATSRWCWDGKVDLDWREYESRFCGEEERYCHVYHYDAYQQLGCGRCTGPDEQYCEECSYEDLCNYDEISGASNLPTTVSSLVPAAYFLAKLA